MHAPLVLAPLVLLALVLAACHKHSKTGRAHSMHSVNMHSYCLTSKPRVWERVSAYPTVAPLGLQASLFPHANCKQCCETAVCP